jgi:hypothetical protein
MLPLTHLRADDTHTLQDEEEEEVVAPIPQKSSLHIA